MQPLCFSYGGNLGEALRATAAMLENLLPLRIAAYDFQLGQVLDGSTAREALAQSLEAVEMEMKEIIAELQGGARDEDVER